MGRNMLGPIRGDWDGSWTGWWGENPPYHAPVFVLTHHPRDPLTMQGGTTFTFVTDGIHSALVRSPVHPEHVVGMPPPQRDHHAGDTGRELGDRNGRQQPAAKGRFHHDGDRLASPLAAPAGLTGSGRAEESPVEIPHVGSGKWTRRAHPYHESRAHHCADQRFCGSLATVDRQVMCST
jgi:hypothetical protein